MLLQPMARANKCTCAHEQQLCHTHTFELTEVVGTTVPNKHTTKSHSNNLQTMRLPICEKNIRKTFHDSGIGTAFEMPIRTTCGGNLLPLSAIGPRQTCVLSCPWLGFHEDIPYSNTNRGVCELIFVNSGPCFHPLEPAIRTAIERWHSPKH